MLGTCYWKQKNTQAYFECLIRAQAVGGTVHRKTQKKMQDVKPHIIQESDSDEAVQRKVTALEAIPPLNTADLVEEDHPQQAKVRIFDFSGNAGYSTTTGQWTTAAGAKASAGPLSANVSVKFDPVTQSAKYSAAIGAKAGGELAPGIKAEGGLSTPVK